MAIPKKNLQDIRTHEGKPNRGLPYKTYLRIGALEMERSRRGKERDSALKRVRSIEARFREIEAEKRMLLINLKKQKINSFRRARKTGHDLATCKNTGGFKLKY